MGHANEYSCKLTPFIASNRAIAGHNTVVTLTAVAAMWSQGPKDCKRTEGVVAIELLTEFYSSCEQYTFDHLHEWEKTRFNPPLTSDV